MSLRPVSAPRESDRLWQPYEWFVLGEGEMKKSILIAALLIAMTGAANAVALPPVNVGGGGPGGPLGGGPPGGGPLGGGFPGGGSLGGGFPGGGPLGGGPPGGPSPGPGTMAAPEIDPSSAMAGFTLLAGGLAVLRGRRRR